MYEENLEVDHTIFAAYCTWLDEHVRDMLALPGVIGAEIFELRDASSATQRRSLCVQYRLADAADLDRYLRHRRATYAPRRETRFPGQFSASRRILQPLASD